MWETTWQCETGRNHTSSLLVFCWSLKAWYRETISRFEMSVVYFMQKKYLEFKVFYRMNFCRPGHVFKKQTNKHPTNSKGTNTSNKLKQTNKKPQTINSPSTPKKPQAPFCLKSLKVCHHLDLLFLLFLGTFIIFLLHLLKSWSI